MADGDLEVFTNVQSRDTSGRYISGIKDKLHRAVEKTVKEAAAAGRARATVKTGAMRASIQPVMFGELRGGVTVGTDHWKMQNYGSRPHDIPGNVTFEWESEGRMWEPGDNTIRHPGNPAVHFMDEAARVAKSRLMSNLESEF